MAEVFLAETRAAPLRQQLWLQAAGLGVLWLLLRPVMLLSTLVKKQNS